LNTKQTLPKVASRQSNLRRLGAFEHFFWLLDQIEPIHFAVAAQIEGQTTTAEWQEVLASLQRRHVLFEASIRTDARGVPHFRTEEGNPIPLRVIEGDALSQLGTQIAREMATPFPKDGVPLIRAVLLHEQQRSIVILVAHHSIADGISLAYAIRDLLQAMAGSALDLLPVPPSHEESLGIVHEPTDEENDGETSVTSPGAIVLRNPQSTPSIQPVLLTRELTTDVRERARKEGTSVQGALGVAVILAINEVTPREDQALPRISIPVSTRSLLGRGEESVLLTDAGTLSMVLPEPASFWELARSAKKSIKAMQSLDLITERRRQMHQFLANLPSPEEVVQIGRQALDANFSLSNLGALPLESQYGRLRLEALWGPAIVTEALDLLGVATVNGRLSFLYCSHAPQPRFMLTMERILRKACAEPLSAEALSGAPRE
jgi:hypothetical protein